MNHDVSQPNFELPELPVEGNGRQDLHLEAQPARPEQYTGPAAPVAQAAPPLNQNPIAPITMVPVSPIPANGLIAQSQSSPQMADDNDLIEKEWVMKAKQIVLATKEDPYTQNREMSKFKADYLKKRYNKDIKIEEA